ncbi:hypothetical protein A2533_02660 [Candidatus Falkowbacteria bacterium RIFOXYD2_FULL_35_9]|nr:MAG: hypothetical protein A2300_03810 [Candidatus Falkowbacteria bacterium RIFOXYB2_FULL_35_7]OGF47767.1 MAG: hypothetical protein A2533_02660 [Candidatus Falkowbacteria bacterium RIFOXYD2_FULL_35_9]
MIYLFSDTFKLGIALGIILVFIISAAIFLVPTIIIYRLTKKRFPSWKIIILTGIIGGLIGVFF